MPAFLAYPRILPADYPPLNIGESAAAALTTLTPSATANTKGSYAQAIAATTRRTRSLLIQLWANPSGTVSKSWLVDIAVGGAGSEVVIVPNLCLNLSGQFGLSNPHIIIPVDIPAGVRLSARCQTQGASGEVCYIKLLLFDGGYTAKGVDALNVSTATSLGTSVTPGNGSKGSYTQLIAATSRAYKGFFFIFDGKGAAPGTYGYYRVDLATGAAASEVVFLPDYLMTNFNATMYCSAMSPYLPFKLLAGVRIACRALGAFDATQFGISVYGVY